MGNKKGKPVSNVLTPQQINMLRANTNFSDYEIMEWHEGFMRDCPNGRLDKKQFLQIYSKFYPQGDAKAFCKYAFDTFDSNDDGTIDFNEFLLSIAARKGGDIDEKLSFAFDVYDISDDGQIDQKELVKMITALYELNGMHNQTGENSPKVRAADIIARLDVSGDRKLSKEEFIAGCKSDPYLNQILNQNI